MSMGIFGGNNTLAGAYRYGTSKAASRTQKEDEKEAAKEVAKEAAKKADFTERLHKAEETKSETDIIVKPDGSRVLVVTMHVGGMETTMSLEISKPTDLPNDSGRQEDGDNSAPAPDTDTSKETRIASAFPKNVHLLDRPM